MSHIGCFRNTWNPIQFTCITRQIRVRRCIVFIYKNLEYGFFSKTYGFLCDISWRGRYNKIKINKIPCQEGDGGMDLSLYLQGFTREKSRNVFWTCCYENSCFYQLSCFTYFSSPHSTFRFTPSRNFLFVYFDDFMVFKYVLCDIQHIVTTH